MAPPHNAAGTPLGKRSYTLRLTFSALITAVIVLIIAVGWSFVLGVMVGRGYNPEKKVPQLATLLPSEQTPKTAREHVGDALPKAEVMKPEDLSYANTLRAKPGQTSVPVKPKNMQNATAPVSTPPVATAPAHTPADPAAPAQPKEPLFDAVYQVATFKDADSVDRLRSRLEGKGLRTRMDKDGKLLKVMVLVRGTNIRLEEVQQLMVEMNLGKPIQRSKTPAGRAR